MYVSNALCTHDVQSSIYQNLIIFLRFILLTDEKFT